MLESDVADVSADLLKYPPPYVWANRANHYIVLHLPQGVSFRAGDWLRFMPTEDVTALLQTLTDFKTARPETHQDLVLLCNLLFCRETNQEHLQLDPRLVWELLDQLVKLLHLEHQQRNRLVYLEQRLSICPGFQPRVQLTSRGKAFIEQNGALPELVSPFG